MDIRRLEEFYTIVQCGSYRAAAESLGVSPALLSNHINALEKRLGIRLLERSAHSVSLTEAGKRFLGDAKALSQEYGQLISSMGRISESSSISMKIGFSGYVIPSRLGPYLDTVNLQYPNISLELFGDQSHDIENSVGSGELDMFFTYAPDTLNFPGIEKEQVYSTKVLALVPLNHHLSHKSSLSPSDLDGECFVLYPEAKENAYRATERWILDRSGISYSVYEGHVCVSAHFVMVPVGKGLALCPRVMRELIPPNTVALPVIDPEFEANMYMFYKADNPNPYMAEFLEGLRSFLKGGREQ